MDINLGAGLGGIETMRRIQEETPNKTVSFVATTSYVDSGDTSTKGTAGEKGTGLGLILCREFTDQLGGTINVQSKLGEGTTFTVQLPVNSE